MIVEDVAPPMTVVRLAEVAVINPRLAVRPLPDEPVSFVPMAALSSVSAEVIAEETRPYSAVAKGYTPFQDKDVLVAKITPCFENNKIGQANLTCRLGFGSTEFHVVRPMRDKIDARYLLHYLRQDTVRAEGELKMTGSAGQRRVPEYFIASLEIPLPSLKHQRHIAGVLDQVLKQQDSHRLALIKLDELLAVLRHSAFNMEL